MAIYSVCDFVDENIATWFPCVKETWFYNSPELIAITLYLMFAILILRTRATTPIIISTNLILSFILATTFSSEYLSAWFMFSLVIAGGMVAFSIVKKFTGE